MSDLTISLFDPNYNYKCLKKFDCGNEMINRFVYKNLKKRVKKNLSRAYVVSNSKCDFIAFFTLESFSITKEELEELNLSSLPPIVPVMKLGMFGVDKSYQKLGIGLRLLSYALKKVYWLSTYLGCKGIFLLSEKDSIPFYKRLGFIELKDISPTPMFLSIETLKDSIES